MAADLVGSGLMLSVSRMRLSRCALSSSNVARRVGNTGPDFSIDLVQEIDPDRRVITSDAQQASFEAKLSRDQLPGASGQCRFLNWHMVAQTGIEPVLLD